MKHRLLTTLAAILIALSAWANGTEINGIYYYLDSDKKTASVTSGDSKYQGDIIIPASVTYYGKTYSVDGIRGGAFYGCTGLTSISIPNSITGIGGSAFEGCTNLTSVTINNYNLTSVYHHTATPLASIFGSQVKEYILGEEVKSITEFLFGGCTDLTSVTIGNSVTSIGNYAFSGCTSLTSVKLGNSVTTIGHLAFAGCTSLTNINIPNSVTTIGDQAFDGCTSLTNINIPNSVTNIGGYAFRNCTSLTNINIPNSVTYISHHAFENCTSLTSVSIPPSVTAIKIMAFYGCTSLTSVNITDIAAWCGISIDGIANNPLHYAHHLYLNGEEVTELNIPESVTTIGVAFSGCTGLTSITIPASVTAIENEAFYGCTSLTCVTINNNDLISYDYWDDWNLPFSWINRRFDNQVTTYIIGDNVTRIGACVFWECTGLTSINIPSSVTSIGSYAFSRCSGLTSINIPESVTSIEEGAFSGCTGLTSITIPSSVEVIGQYAFGDCTSLTSIKVEADNTKYDSRDNCNAIIETASNTLIAGCMNSTIPNSVTSIGDEAFYGCTGLTSITIPNSVTYIKGGAFRGCTGLTSINIPSSVTSIGSYAFEGCTGLTDVYALRTAPEAYNCYQDAFYDVPTSTCILHVPKGSKEAYKAIKPWNRFENIVEDAKPSTEPADLNGDGSVNVGDVTTLVNIILSKEGEDAEGFDLNGDGSVNVGDVTTLVNKILGK